MGMVPVADVISIIAPVDGVTAAPAVALMMEKLLSRRNPRKDYGPIAVFMLTVIRIRKMSIEAIRKRL